MIFGEARSSGRRPLEESGEPADEAFRASLEAGGKEAAGVLEDSGIVRTIECEKLLA